MHLNLPGIQIIRSSKVSSSNIRTGRTCWRIRRCWKAAQQRSAFSFGLPSFTHLAPPVASCCIFKFILLRFILVPEKKKISLQSNTIFSNTTTSSYKVPSIFHPHCTHHYTNTFSVVTKFQDMPFLFSLNSRTEFSFSAVQHFHFWPNSIFIFGKTKFSFFAEENVHVLQSSIVVGMR